MVCPSKSMIEGEIVIPQVCKRLVVALIAGSLINGCRLPLVSRREVVIVPEFSIESKGCFELQPRGQCGFTRDVAQQIISFRLL